MNSPSTETAVPLYDGDRCRLCCMFCMHGIAKENHARKHQREGTAKIYGFGGPDGRRYELAPRTAAAYRRRKVTKNPSRCPDCHMAYTPKTCMTPCNGPGGNYPCDYPTCVGLPHG